MKLRLKLEHTAMFDLYNFLKWETDDKEIADIRREIFRVLEEHRNLKTRKVDNFFEK